MIANTSFFIKLNLAVALILLIFGIIFYPAITESTIALSKLNKTEIYYLRIVSIVMILFSSLFILFRKKINEKVPLFFIPILILITVEITFRLFIIFFISGDVQNNLIKQSNWTFNEYSRFTGHPFLQFTGKPSQSNKNDTTKNGSTFNNFGFTGKDFDINKKSGVLRVACIGESTTEDGYPAYLETYLNNNGIKSEVLNFGHSFWTSAHSLINYMLVVSDFHPDIIIIHHGWNEHMIRNTKPGKFKNDYSHTLISYTEPFVWDKYFIRVSALYRYFKFMNNKQPDWIDLNGYIQNKKYIESAEYKNSEELIPFQRNITAIVDNGRLNGANVYIATIPYSTDEKMDFHATYKNIEQCNRICRIIADTKKLPLIDLDSSMTGKMNYIFKDLGHTNEAGKKIKAQLIGDVIIAGAEYGESDKTP